MAEVLNHSLGDQQQPADHRQRQQHVKQCAHHVLPEVPESFPLRTMIPRISAIRTTIPAAADTKFWTVIPIIWLKYVSVVSPP